MAPPSQPDASTDPVNLQRATTANTSAQAAPAGEAKSAPRPGGAGGAGAGPNDDQQISQILAEMSQQQRASPEASSSRPQRSSAGSTQTSPRNPAYSLAVAGSSNLTTAPHEVGAIASAALGQQQQPFFPQAPHMNPPFASTSTAHPGVSVSLPPISSVTGAAPAAAVGLPVPPAPATAAVQPDRDELSASPVVPGKGSKTGKGRGRGKSDERMNMNEEDWERSRKDNHKEVERRRRETINAGITQLGLLLPPGAPSHPAPPSSSAPSAPGAAPSSVASPPPPQSAAAAAKVNKAHVLTRAAAYITQLREQQARTIDQWTLDKLLADQNLKHARDECDRLRAENEALRERVAQLEGAGGGLGGGATAANGGTKRAAPDEPGAIEGADAAKKARVEP